MKRLCKFCQWNTVDEDAIDVKGKRIYQFYPFCSEKHKYQYEIRKKKPMKEAKLYYIAPSDESFEDMKKACLEVWGQYKNSPGDYYGGKITRIPEMQNIKDNFMYLLAMFDRTNQRKVMELVNQQTRDDVIVRLLDVGMSPRDIENVTGLFV